MNTIHSIRSARSIYLRGRNALPAILVATAFVPLAPGLDTLSHGEPCAKTAALSRQASRADARADFFETLAGCVNESNPGQVLKCVGEALQSWSEALDEIAEQYQSRVALCGLLGPGPYDPDIDPNDFSSVVTNPYFLLTPGLTLAYEGKTEEGMERVEETTLSETREVMGVDCAVVHSVEFLEGEVIEDTYDYYAQDDQGNVWYFGELSFELEGGYIVNMDGSWLAGIDGAKAGIIMLAAPSPGKVYRQEWFVNEAEDIGTFLSSTQSVTVPYMGGTLFSNCWQIMDTTPLEASAMEYKFYARGVGLVQSVDLETGEHVDLVDIFTN